MSLTVTGELQGARSGPVRELEVAITLRWNFRDPAFLLGLSGRLKHGATILSETIRVEEIHFHGSDRSSLVERNNDYHGRIVVCVSTEAIRYVEANRGNADIELILELKYAWQTAITHTPERKADFAVSPPVLGGGSVNWDATGNILRRIPRSDWTSKILPGLGWGDIELFEVPRL